MSSDVDRKTKACHPADAESTERDGFEIDVQHPATEVVLLRASGEIDIWTSITLMEAIVRAFAERPELIAIDLGDVSFMDAAGLRVLTDATLHMEDTSVTLAVICPANARVARLLELAETHRTLTIHESRDDALRPWLSGAEELPTGV